MNSAEDTQQAERYAKDDGAQQGEPVSSLSMAIWVRRLVSEPLDLEERSDDEG